MFEINLKKHIKYLETSHYNNFNYFHFFKSPLLKYNLFSQIMSIALLPFSGDFLVPSEFLPTKSIHICEEATSLYLYFRAGIQSLCFGCSK